MHTSGLCRSPRGRILTPHDHIHRRLIRPLENFIITYDEGILLLINKCTNNNEDKIKYTEDMINTINTFIHSFVRSNEGNFERIYPYLRNFIYIMGRLLY